jgi:cytochrome c oxidase assembly factor CtaG
MSPLHFLGEHLFTFHMIEHELVMAISAPLIVLARPIGILLWSLPRNARHLVMRVVKSPSVERTWTIISGGTVATLLHGLAIWIWHVPALFDATVTVVALHRLQHLSFFLTAIFFWWAVIWKVGKGAAAWHLFITMMHTSILGALLSVAPRVAYLAQTRAAPDWGMTPLEDQQLAGIVMWVPGGIIYAGAALAMLAAWISSSSKGGIHATAIR